MFTRSSVRVGLVRYRKSRRVIPRPPETATVTALDALSIGAVRRTLERLSGARRPTTSSPGRAIRLSGSWQAADGPGREVVLAHILDLNPSASEAFLASFTTRELELYRDHLLSAMEPRGRTARWVRPGDMPAICVSEAA